MSRPLLYDHLLGLEWVSGESDCYALLRRFYMDNWGIALRPYAYPEEWWNTAPETDLIMKNFAAEGFNVVTDVAPLSLRVGDVLLIARGTRVASHIGVWIGGNRFLHHPRGALSCPDRWAGRWANMTLAVVRHPDVPPEGPPERVDLMDLLPTHKREEYRNALAARTASRFPGRPPS